MITIVNYMISFISVPITTRLYDPSIIGQINFFNANVSLILVFVVLGLDEAMFRLYHNYELDKDKKRLFTYPLLISIIVILVFMFGIYLVGFDIINNLLGVDTDIAFICLGVAVFVNVVLTYFQRIHRLNNKLFLFAVQTLMISSSVKAVMIFNGLNDKTFESFISIMLFVNLTLAIIFIFANRHMFEFYGLKKFAKENTKEIFGYGFPVMVDQLISNINIYVASLFIKNVLTFSMLGIYSSAKSLAGLISLAQVGINLGLQPYIYENYDKEDNKFEMIYRIVCSVVLVGVLSITLFQPIIINLLGEKYQSAYSIFPILMIAPCCGTLSIATSSGFEIMKKTNLRAFSNFITFILNIIFLAIIYFAMPEITLFAVCMAQAISALVGFMIKTYVSQKLYKTMNSYKYLLATLAVLIANIFLNIMFTGFIRVVVYVGLIVLYCCNANELKNIIKIGISYITKK